MKNDKKILGDYSPDVTPTPLSPTGDTPIDFYSWGDQTSIGLTSRKKQMEDGLEAAFDSIEITEDTSTPETDYVLKVLGKDAGRVIVSVDSIIKNAYYDKTTQELVFVVNVGGVDKEIRISVKDLIKTYVGDETTIHIDENNVISITKEVMDTFTDLYEKIAQEAETRESEDGKLQSAIESEETDRKSADKTLQTNIDKVETNSKKYTDDTVKAEKERAEGVEKTIKETKADKEHTHKIADVENLQTVLDNKLNITDIESIPNELIYKLFGIECVDLGLPSGLIWSKSNIGVQTETDYGKYFQWGDTSGAYIGKGAEAYSTWKTAPFNNGSSSYNKEYFVSIVDEVAPNNTLSSEYDAAIPNIGKGWRIPTEADFKELLNNTNNEWIEDYNGSGVNGRKFTSKTDSSKYIFIPAAGYVVDGSLSYQGIKGYVTSSTLPTQPNMLANSIILRIDSTDSHTTTLSRAIGLNIRPVFQVVG